MYRSLVSVVISVCGSLISVVILVSRSLISVVISVYRSLISVVILHGGLYGRVVLVTHI